MKTTLFALAIAALPAAGALAHPGAHAVSAYFTEQIRARPLDPGPYIQRGIARSNDGEFELALRDFRQAEQLGEPVAVAFDLGVLHYRMGDFAMAQRYFDAFLAHRPRHAATLEYRARLRRDAGDRAGAVADYRAFLAVEPHPNPGHYSAAAALLAELPEPGSREALDLLDEGMARLGVLPQLQRQAIALELRDQRIDAAIARLRTLEGPLRASPEWCVDMGELLLRANESGEALGYFGRAERVLAASRLTPARQELLRRAHAGRAQASG